VHVILPALSDKACEAATPNPVKRAIARACTDPTYRALAYVSSAGIRVFLLAARKLRGQGTLLLAAPSPMVRQVFDIAGVDAFVDICETTAAAVDRLRS
jgi:anti-anti-sigma factor